MKALADMHRENWAKGQARIYSLEQKLESRDAAHATELTTLRQQVTTLKQQLQEKDGLIETLKAQNTNLVNASTRGTNTGQSSSSSNRRRVEPTELPGSTAALNSSSSSSKLLGEEGEKEKDQVEDEEEAPHLERFKLDDGWSTPSSIASHSPLASTAAARGRESVKKTASAAASSGKGRAGRSERTGKDAVTQAQVVGAKASSSSSSSLASGSLQAAESVYSRPSRAAAVKAAAGIKQNLADFSNVKEVGSDNDDDSDADEEEQGDESESESSRKKDSDDEKQSGDDSDHNDDEASPRRRNVKTARRRCRSKKFVSAARLDGSAASSSNEEEEDNGPTTSQAANSTKTTGKSGRKGNRSMSSGDRKKIPHCVFCEEYKPSTWEEAQEHQRQKHKQVPTNLNGGDMRQRKAHKDCEDCGKDVKPSTSNADKEKYFNHRISHGTVASPWICTGVDKDTGET
jgi:hypothetical protein